MTLENFRSKNQKPEYRLKDGRTLIKYEISRTLILYL